ncbi:MAG: FG-GAP-like repeat-containing protein [Desulfobacterales bacterium]|nr:FG-GAP-like repeat-containing protein [Desulfobacterales bacterium]
MKSAAFAHGLVTALFALLFSAFAPLGLPPAQAQSPRQVLVLPFDMHAAEDLTFLQNGIEDMLSTRLAREGQVAVIPKARAREAAAKVPRPVTPAAAAELGRQLGADFVVYGSLTVFGESISTDARFLDVAEGKPVVVFGETGQSQGEVIGHVNDFAARINATVFGREAAAAPAAPQAEAVPEARRHPEKLVSDQELIYSQTGPLQSAGAGAAFQTWKSRRFREDLNGLAVGDVDGDGKNEAVFISDRMVFVYRYSQQGFEKVAEIPGAVYETFLAVDVADINANGRAEIFVTCVQREKQQMISFVLEADGSGYRRIVDRENWYFRVIQPAGRDPLLMGQRGAIKQPFVRGVYNLVWDNGSYVSGERQSLPAQFSVFGFTYGDVLNTGEETLVGFDRDDYLVVMGPGGEQEWRSEEALGGTAAFVEFPMAASSSIADYKDMDRYFLAQRVHVADLDEDGKQDVIVVNNLEASGRMLARLRTFKNGHVECRTWNQLGLGLKWRTQAVGGHISDSAVADFNNDGKPELVYAVVSKTAPVVGQERSYIVAQSVEKAPKAGETAAP